MNTSGFQTLHSPYEPVVSDSKDNYYQMPEVTITGDLGRFRVFIPPGTRILSLNIFEYGGQTVFARHGKPPEEREVPDGYFAAASRTLDQLASEDQIISENHEGKIAVIQQGFSLPYVTIFQAGWLYIRTVGGRSSSVYYNKFQLGVDSVVFNAWIGSINWERDVEGVVEFGVTSFVPKPVVSAPISTPSSVPSDAPKQIRLGEFGIWNWSNGKWTIQ
jgi:hypothetical protein